MNISSRLLLLGAAVLGIAGSAIAPAQTPDPGSATEAPAADPTAFVKSAAMGCLAEVELAKLALTRSQDAAIRTFADRMIKDHNKAHAELAAISRRKGFDVPTSLNARDEALVKEGAARSGPEFDTWYSGHMVVEHEKAVALFQSATNSGDPDLAAFAKKTLPVLEEHQRLAKQLPREKTIP
jgi:putative membrane protein